MYPITMTITINNEQEAVAVLAAVGVSSLGQKSQAAAPTPPPEVKELGPKSEHTPAPTPAPTPAQAPEPAPVVKPPAALVPEVKELGPHTPAPTYDETAKAITLYMGTHGAAKAREMLQRFGGNKLKEISPSDYAALIALLEEA